MRALRDTHPDLFATNRLGFVAVIEEECTGNGALTSITDHGVVADEVVVLESTDLGLLLGGIGVLWIDLTVTAASAHANAVHKSANAIDLGMRLVAALRAWSAGLMASDPEPAMAATGPDAGVYNVNLGTITAGDWASSSPSVANLGIRVGYPRGWSPSRAEAEVRAVIAETAAADQEFTHQPTVVPAGFRARGYVLDADAPLARDLATAHLAAHGEYPVANMTGSTTDARTYLEDFGIPAVCYGPIAHDIHGIDESVELDSIVAAARTLARFIVARFSAAQA
jgi:acetylornithine deacetylase